MRANLSRCAICVGFGLILLVLTTTLQSQASQPAAEPILTETLIFDDGSYGVRGQSPDSRFLAVSFSPSGESLEEHLGDFWLLDVATATLEQVPLEQEIAGFGTVVWIDSHTVITTWWHDPEEPRNDDTIGFIDLSTGAMTPLTQLADDEHGFFSLGPGEHEVLLTNEGDATSDVFTFNWETGEREPFITTDTHEKLEPMLSPSGRYLAFHGLFNEEPEGIYSLDLETDEVAFIEGVYRSRFYGWSPDDRWFLTWGANELAQSSLYLTENRADGAQFALTGLNFSPPVFWAYNGEYIAFYKLVEPIPEPPGYAAYLYIVPTAELGLTLPLDMETLEQRFERVR